MNLSELQAAPDSDRTLHVGGMYCRIEAICRVVCHFDSFFFVFRHIKGGRRPEGFVVKYRHIFRDVLNDGRHKLCFSSICRTSNEESCTLCFGVDKTVMGFLHYGSRGTTSRSKRRRYLLEKLSKFFSYALLNNNALSRKTNLSVMYECYSTLAFMLHKTGICTYHPECTFLLHLRDLHHPGRVQHIFRRVPSAQASNTYLPTNQ